MPRAHSHEERSQTPREIFMELDRYVIGQERAKRTLALAAYTHMRRAAFGSVHQSEQVWKKSNVLLIGPTGSGKTLLAKHLANVLKVPFVSADATEYTEAGYYGRDVDQMLADLFERAGRNVELTERGIVFIDEVDKLARRSGGKSGSSASRDVGGEGVQQALLKMMEASEVRVMMKSENPMNRGDFVRIDTSKILFICAGAFSDLLERRNRPKKPKIGFSHVSTTEIVSKKPIGTKELVSYGMLPEFLGRLPIITELEPLSKDDLVDILTEPDDALIAEFSDRLEADGIELIVHAAALAEIAHHAEQRGVGARGLRAIVEEVFGSLLFDAPDLNVRKVTIDAPYVKQKLAP